MEIRKFWDMVREMHPANGYEPILRRGIDYPSTLSGIIIKIPETIRAKELGRFFTAKQLKIYQDKRIDRIFEKWVTPNGSQKNRSI